MKHAGLTRRWYENDLMLESWYNDMSIKKDVNERHDVDMDGQYTVHTTLNLDLSPTLMTSSVGGWVRDLTAEGIESNPGPGGRDTDKGTSNASSSSSSFSSTQSSVLSSVDTSTHSSTTCRTALDLATPQVSDHDSFQCAECGRRVITRDVNAPLTAVRCCSTRCHIDWTLTRSSHARRPALTIGNLNAYYGEGSTTQSRTGSTALYDTSSEVTDTRSERSRSSFGWRRRKPRATIPVNDLPKNGFCHNQYIYNKMCQQDSCKYVHLPPEKNPWDWSLDELVKFMEHHRPVCLKYFKFGKWGSHSCGEAGEPCRFSHDPDEYLRWANRYKLRARICLGCDHAFSTVTQDGTILELCPACFRLEQEESQSDGPSYQSLATLSRDESRKLTTHDVFSRSNSVHTVKGSDHGEDELQSFASASHSGSNSNSAWHGDSQVARSLSSSASSPQVPSTALMSGMHKSVNILRIAASAPLSQTEQQLLATRPPSLASSSATPPHHHIPTDASSAVGSSDGGVTEEDVGVSDSSSQAASSSSGSSIPVQYRGGKWKIIPEGEAEERISCLNCHGTGRGSLNARQSGFEEIRRRYKKCPDKQHLIGKNIHQDIKIGVGGSGRSACKNPNVLICTKCSAAFDKRNRSRFLGYLDPDAFNWFERHVVRGVRSETGSQSTTESEAIRKGFSRDYSAEKPNRRGRGKHASNKR